MVVLDELNLTLSYGYLDTDEVAAVLDKPEQVSIIMTGRRAPQAILDVADTVTEHTMGRRLQGGHSTRALDPRQTHYSRACFALRLPASSEPWARRMPLLRASWAWSPAARLPRRPPAHTFLDQNGGYRVLRTTDQVATLPTTGWLRCGRVRTACCPRRTRRAGAAPAGCSRRRRRLRRHRARLVERPAAHAGRPHRRHRPRRPA